MMDAGQMLGMEPLDLIDYLNTQVSFPDMLPLEDEDRYGRATEILNKSTAYICYFEQMETAARIRKRETKRQKASPEEIDRCIGVEDVFKAFKRVAEQQYDNVTRFFTAKRLVLEEFKKQGKMV